jgi:hypothetical protein
MDTRNITLALPPELLREAKVLAAEQGTSISALVATLLRDLATRRRRLSAARKRALGRLKNPADLGTAGRARWRREDLHER